MSSIQYEVTDDTAVITLNRPERFNAIDRTISTGLIEALERAAEEARAAVLTGAGKAFCSGADLAELMDDYESGSPDLSRHLDAVFHPVVEALAGCRVPTVAAVNGVAAGAGMGLALGCDLRVMAESAFLVSSFTGIGLAPDSGTTWLLPRMVGVSTAIELAMTNRRVGAEEARALGLCAEVAADGEAPARALDLAGKLADLVPDSLVTTRRLIKDASVSSFAEALEAEKAEQGRLGRTPEHLEGVRAFLDKRDPDFRGASG